MAGLCCSNIFDGDGLTVVQTLCINEAKEKSDYFVFDIMDTKTNEKLNDDNPPDKKEGAARC